MVNNHIPISKYTSFDTVYFYQQVLVHVVVCHRDKRNCDEHVHVYLRNNAYTYR